MFKLRLYQENFVKKVIDIFTREQDQKQSTLIIMPTGTGKTVVFSEIIRRLGVKTLVLAHRYELLDQARKKLISCGLTCTVEQGASHAVGTQCDVVLGSVQTLARESRLNEYTQDFFGLIVIDEAHHVSAESYQRIIKYFKPSGVKILGVTATPDRGDSQDLMSTFECVADEYFLTRAISDGYLVDITAPSLEGFKIDMSHVKKTAGDFECGSAGKALECFLDQIADEVVKRCQDRKTVIFCPVIATSQDLTRILCEKGFKTLEVNGASTDRDEILSRFDTDDSIKCLCNAMLLTEGWDCPKVDCVICLRPTKIRALYAQIIGRGLRPYPGKKDCMILDFFQYTQSMELSRPASLIARNRAEETAISEKMAAGVSMTDAESAVETEIIARSTPDRNAAMMKLIKGASYSTLGFSPIEVEHMIGDGFLRCYQMTEEDLLYPPTPRQLSCLERCGVVDAADFITSKRMASKYISRLIKRRQCGLASLKQISMLKKFGISEYILCREETAARILTEIQQNDWRVPVSMDVHTVVQDYQRA